MIVSLLGNLAGSVIGLIGAKGKAKQTAIRDRMAAMERSWTDEFITVVWFSPLIVAWFSPTRADAWISAVTSQGDYFLMLVTITMAVFGIGKMQRPKG